MNIFFTFVSSLFVLNFSFGEFSLADSSQDGTSVAKYVNYTKGEQTPLFSHISTINIDQIFSHIISRDGEPELFGAKAVIISLHGQPPTVYFFPLGNGRYFNGLHHYDVLGVAKDTQNKIANANDYKKGSDSDYLENAQGFQLQAKKIKGKMYVTGFDIDSAITGNQEAYLIKLSPEVQSQLLDTTIGRIESSLRQFQVPSWPKRLKWKARLCRSIFN